VLPAQTPSPGAGAGDGQSRSGGSAPASNRMFLWIVVHSSNRRSHLFIG
jgi:hypothetical protein